MIHIFKIGPSCRPNRKQQILKTKKRNQNKCCPCSFPAKELMFNLSLKRFQINAKLAFINALESRERFHENRKQRKNMRNMKEIKEERRGINMHSKTQKKYYMNIVSLEKQSILLFNLFSPQPANFINWMPLLKKRPVVLFFGVCRSLMKFTLP